MVKAYNLRIGGLTNIYHNKMHVRYSYGRMIIIRSGIIEVISQI